ncbi:MAG: iron ABC transporter permease [Chloroflexi bacterium]|nr:iron ABC transporter permease [Chloroflexota bacterium]
MSIKNRVNRSSILMACLFLVVGFMILYPVGMVFFGSVWSSMPGASGHLSPRGYIEAFGNPSTYSLLWTTFWLATVRTVISVAIAISLAWIMARTNVRGKRILEISLLFTFFVPLLPRILAWIVLLSPRTGLLNVFLADILPFHLPPLNVFSYGGIILVSILVWVPVLYIFIAPAFKSMDASLEEAAKASGASMWSTVTRINLPLLAPAILATTALGFVRSMDSFVVEAMLGIRADIYVLTTKVYNYINLTEPPNYPAAMALSVTMLVITFFIVFFQWKLLGGKEYTTVTGKGYRPQVTKLGWGRWIAFAYVLTFLVVSTFLPLGVLIWGSFMKVVGVFSDSMYTFSHYQRAFSASGLWLAMKNTVLMSTAVATAGMVLCSLVAYTVVKTRVSGRRVLDFVVWIPWAVPSIVMALGFLWAYLFLPLPFRIYGTLLLMILALTTTGLPLGTRTMTSTIVQISNELEESAKASGATWLRTFTIIMVPLLSRGLVSGWILLFAFAVKDLSTVILLYSPESTVMSTQVWDWWRTGFLEEAIVLGLLEAVLIAICFVAATMLGERVGPQMSKEQRPTPKALLQ